MILYDAFLALAGLLLSPRLLKGRHRQSLFPRLGQGLPQVQKRGQKVFWFHSISVGETRALSQVIRATRTSYPEATLVISTVTETGQAEAKRLFGQLTDQQFYMPVDFSFLVDKALDRIQPDYLILCETDFWYHLFQRSKARGVKIALISGKMSERSARRLGHFPWIAKALFSPLDLLSVQSEDQAKRFLDLGIPASKIKLTGNLKLDDQAEPLGEEDLARWREDLGLSSDDQVLCLGSTHAPEEKELLDSLSPLLDGFPRLKILVVPRHPERFDEVWSLLQAYPQAARWSHGVPGHSRIILVDTMGRLRDSYQLSTLAVVAGSFTSQVGGHNILEPLLYKVPVLFGPYMKSQVELEKLVLTAKAGWKLNQEELARTIWDCLSFPKLAEEASERGVALMDSIKGSTQRTLAELRDALDLEKLKE